MFFFIAKDCYFPKLSLKTRVLTYIFPSAYNPQVVHCLRMTCRPTLKGQVSGIAQSFRSLFVLNRDIDIRDICGMGWSQLTSAN